LRKVSRRRGNSATGLRPREKYGRRISKFEIPEFRTAMEEEIEKFRQHERTGRVLGDEDFQKKMEKCLGWILLRK
jgi:hypothetical protein